MIGLLGGIKKLQIARMIAHGSQFVPAPETVTTTVARTDSWESRLTAVGSLVEVQGVMVTAELTGKVVRIAFEPGTKVNAGDLLLQQDISSEAAQLRAVEANVALAKLSRTPEKIVGPAHHRPITGRQCRGPVQGGRGTGRCHPDCHR
jgi:membrane fusion protein (multidrug efflux system)